MMKLFRNVHAEGMGHDWPKERRAILLRSVGEGPVLHDSHEYVFENNCDVRHSS